MNRAARYYLNCILNGLSQEEASWWASAVHHGRRRPRHLRRAAIIRLRARFEPALDGAVRCPACQASVPDEVPAMRRHARLHRAPRCDRQAATEPLAPLSLPVEAPPVGKVIPSEVEP